ncbi:nicotinate (nicotinamide) nucleotide adenylyltransferase [Ningiella sp. W23]|uniref:nicotinate (nicotinamide) nucleotide adenylyltransferase n=1 Tax=Ningiella sp. W23 TaxID=3023715 RepID=UPI00375715AC
MISQVRQHPLKAIFGGTFDPPHFGHVKPVQALLDTLDIEECELIPAHIPVHKNVSTAPAHRLQMTRLMANTDARLFVNEIEIHRHLPSYTVNTLEELNRQFDAHSLCFIMGLDSFMGLADWFQPQRLFSQCHIIVLVRSEPLEDSHAESKQNETLSCVQNLIANKRSATFNIGMLKNLPERLRTLLPSNFHIQSAISNSESSPSSNTQNTQSVDINGILRSSKCGELLFFANDCIEVSSSALRQSLGQPATNIKNTDATYASASLKQCMNEEVLDYIRKNKLYRSWD